MVVVHPAGKSGWPADVANVGIRVGPVAWVSNHRGMHRTIERHQAVDQSYDPARSTVPEVSGLLISLRTSLLYCFFMRSHWTAMDPVAPTMASKGLFDGKEPSVLGASEPRGTHSDTEHASELSKEKQPSAGHAKEEAPEKKHYGWRFWMVFPSLCVTAFMASLEGTIVTTALPTINSSLDTGDNYVWVINMFFLTR